LDFLKSQKAEDARLLESSTALDTDLVLYDHNVSVSALFFQTGYLTIKSKQPTNLGVQYLLDSPNSEVRDSFARYALLSMLNNNLKELNFLISQKDDVKESILNVDPELFREVWLKFLAPVANNLFAKKDEAHYHSLFVVAMNAMGFMVTAEEKTRMGNADVVIRFNERDTENRNIVVVVEIKYTKDEAESEQKLNEAFSQMRQRRYAEKYMSKDLKIILAGMIFISNKDIRVRFEEEEKI
jgi:Holliday junction resolvase-like predicted endonuclease